MGAPSMIKRNQIKQKNPVVQSFPMQQRQLDFTQEWQIAGTYGVITTETSEYEIFSLSSYGNPILNLLIDEHNYPCLIDPGATFGTLNQY